MRSSFKSSRLTLRPRQLVSADSLFGYPAIQSRPADSQMLRTLVERHPLMAYHEAALYIKANRRTDSDRFPVRGLPARGIHWPDREEERAPLRRWRLRLSTVRDVHDRLA